MTLWALSDLHYLLLCSFTLNQRQAEAVKDLGRKGKAGLREKAAADPVIQNALKIDILLFEKAQELFNRQVSRLVMCLLCHTDWV